MCAEYVLDLVRSPSPLYVLSVAEQDLRPASELFEFVRDYSGWVIRSFQRMGNFFNAMQSWRIGPAP